MSRYGYSSLSSLLACGFAVLTCDSGKAYIKVISQSPVQYFNEQSYQIKDGDTTLVTSTPFTSNEFRTTEYCLDAATNYQYKLHLKDSYGDGWGSPSYVMVEGLYGNIIFKGTLISGGKTNWPIYDLTVNYPIMQSSDWKMSSEAGSSWTEYSFSDSTWATYNADTATASSTGTQYYRKTFTAFDNLAALETRILYRYGIVAYINGNEIYRDNMPSGDVTASTLASGSYSTAEYRGVIRPSTILVSSAQNVLAVEIHFTSLTHQEIPSFNAWLAVYSSSTQEDPCYIVPYTPTMNSNGLTNTLENLVDWSIVTSYTYNDIATAPLDITFNYGNVSPLVNGIEYYSPYTPNANPKNFVISGTNDSINPVYTDILSETNPTYANHAYYYNFAHFSSQYYKTYRLRVNSVMTSTSSLNMFELHFAVCKFDIPTSITYEPSVMTVVQGVDLVNAAPTITGFSGCSVNPQLPSGLTLNTNTCTISGVVIATVPQTVYTITATGGFTGTVTITSSPCNGNVIEIRRVYGAQNAQNERYKLIDLSNQSTAVEVGFNGGQVSGSEVVTRHCLTGTRYELELGVTSSTYWLFGSFIYINGVIGEETEPILHARVDDLIGLPNSIYFNIDYSIKAMEQWSYKTEFVSNWYNSDTSGWSTGSRGSFTAASSGRIQIFKKSFTVSNLQNISGFSINLRYKYGCIVYLNNHEVFRNRVTGDLSSSSTATDSYSDLHYRTITLPVKTITIGSETATDYIVQGSNHIAIALVAMSDSQTAIDFDCAVRLFGDSIADRTMDITASSSGFSYPEYAFQNINTHMATFYSCSAGSIDIQFANDRREWISSFSFTNAINSLSSNPESVTLKARNSATEEWTTIVAYPLLAWWAKGQTKTFYIRNNKPYNIYRFDNINGHHLSETYCTAFITRIAVYANNLNVEVPTLTYSNFNAYKDIEMAEVFPSSFLYSEFTINPELPAGLSIDPSSGTLIGTPTETKASQTYTVSAKNIGGQSVTATFTMSVIVCTGTVNLITVTVRSDNYINEMTYELYAGRGNTGSPIASGQPVETNALLYLDYCLENGLYTFRGLDAYGDGWIAPAGYKLSIDQGTLNFELNQVKGGTPGSGMTSSSTTFSSYIPFQIDHSDWKAFTSTAEVPSDWNTVSFNDASWETKKAAAIKDSESVTVYIRKTFDIPNLSDYQVLNVHVAYIGGIAAYFNGNLVARFNLPETFTRETEALTAHATEGYSNFHIILATTGAVQGTNVIAFEHHRVNGASSVNSVFFEASGIFGVEECSTVVDSFSEVTSASITGGAIDLFKYTPFNSITIPNVKDAEISWSVENLLGSKFNSFVMHLASTISNHGFSLYGRFSEEDQENSMFAETGLTVTSLRPNAYDVPLGIAGFKDYRYVVDVPSNYASSFNAFLFKYCKPASTGVCPAIDNYPSVGEGQISPAECQYGYRGYSFRTCTNGVLSDIDYSNCQPKIPADLHYATDRFVFVKDTAVQTDAPTFMNLIDEFYLDTNVNLPAGLTLDSKTGVISGKPTEIVNMKAFTIYGKNAKGSAATTITITIRIGECAAEGNFGKTNVGETAIYECSKQGSFVGTVKRTCVLGEKDGVWDKPSGTCFPTVGIIIIVIIVIIVLVVAVFIIIRLTKKSKTVGSRGKNTNKSKTMKAQTKKDAKETKKTVKV